MPLLVRIAPENEVNAIRCNRIAPTRWKPDPEGTSGWDRGVWAFPVLPSYTLTHSWARELKRSGLTSLAAVTFRLPDAGPLHAQTLNPQGSIRIQHDHGLVAEPGQDLRSQLPSQLLVEPLARLGTHSAVQHREHSSRPWLAAHEDVKKNCPEIRFTVFAW